MELSGPKIPVKEMTYKEKDKMDEILLRYSGVDLYIINK